jgi:23S rRNA U2552 (ribose-2'-O)-methylase RlmE/FtsJ
MMLKHLAEFSPKWPVKVFNFQECIPNDHQGDAFALFTDNVWEIEYLNHLKNNLNSVKHQLDDKDVTEWSRHTSVTDASAWIKQEIQSKIHPEPELLTRAWIKMHEILSSFPIIDETLTHSTTRALLLCEAPGAFVSAVNHFIHDKFNGSDEMRSQNGPLFQWTATSLNPYHDSSDVLSKAITDDSFIKFTLKNWFFGDDGTGNILNHSFIPSLKKLIQKEGQFDLVTGDGGTSFINDPENQVSFSQKPFIRSFLSTAYRICSPPKQENGSLSLILAESVAAMFALKSGGSFVLKAFSLLQPQSMCLVYLLWSSFSYVSIFKPVTSKSGNNELYIVCRDFHPDSSAAKTLMLLEEHITNSSLDDLISKFALLPLKQIQMSFVIEFESAISQFCHWQKEAIETNIKLHNSMNSICKKEVTAVKKHRARVYLKKFPLHPILPHQRLVPPLITASAQTGETNDHVNATHDALHAQLK